MVLAACIRLTHPVAFVSFGGIDTLATTPIIVSAGLGLVCLLPRVNRSLDSSLQSFKNPTPRLRVVISIAIFFATIFGCYSIALLRGRGFYPILHDEFVYLLQARMMAHGRLWLPSHPLADFFESFFVIVRPVYTGIYFPGTPIFHLPGIWLSLPEWVIPLLISAAAVCLLYLIVTELCDGLAGLLAALLMVSLPTFRGTSIMVMSHPAMLLLGESMIFAWLRWRSHRSMKWAAMIGVCAGWAAITRPADALAYAAAVGIGMLLDLRTCQNRQRVLVPLVILLSAAPFLILQIAFDRGVTGRAFTTPYTQYLQREQPQTAFSFRQSSFDPSTHPASNLLERQRYYDDFLAPEIRDYKQAGPLRIWFNKRLPLVIRSTLSHVSLLILLPFSLIGLSDRRRMILCLTGPLLVLLYSFNPLLLEWYTVPWLPSIILGIVIGIEQLAKFSRHAIAIRNALSVTVATLALYSLLTPSHGTLENLRSTVLDQLQGLDVTTNRPRAIALFTFSASANFNIDPVYNIDSLSPDDAHVIRARDLGPQRDVELLQYYAQRQPDREVITIDLGTGQIINWGTVDEALKHWPAPHNALINDGK